MEKPVESRFNAAMMDIGERAKSELGFTPHRFCYMVLEHGGVRAAKMQLQSPVQSEEYAPFWETLLAQGRLDLSVEALIQAHAEYKSLFDEKELRTALSRLQEYKYPPVIDPLEPFIGAF